MNSSALKYNDAKLPTVLVLLYICLSYAGGWYYLFHELIAINLIAMFSLSHGMIISAYLLHECAHNTVFNSKNKNKILGEILSWVSSSCYGNYEDIKNKHIRHHRDRADIIALDYRATLKKFPAFYHVVAAFEYVYIPAVEIYMHLLVMSLPFTSKKRSKLRTRVFLIGSVRIFVFVLIAMFSIKAVLLYFIAWCLMLTVLRFMDAFQHTYDIYEVLDSELAFPKQDRDYEHANTFSNLLSIRFPWVNLLVLNFCYHNAHHAIPKEPWYRLPQLNHKLYGNSLDHIIPLSTQLKAFHKNRIKRILNDNNNNELLKKKDLLLQGVNGVSFLTAH